MEAICTSVFVLRDGAALLGLRHYRASEWQAISVWTTPGGKCDPGEQPEECVRRETAEETGITELLDLRCVGQVPRADLPDVPMFVYVAATTQEHRNVEPKKFSEWRYVPLDAVPENFINPPALALVRAHLGQ